MGTGALLTPPVVAVVGATAVGKSDLAVHLALALAGEAVNADSMQLYRGMDVGTAKLTTAERRGVTHHLLDIWSVRDDADVATYQSLARETFAAVSARGHRPVLVGGSGLYVRAALDRMDFPGTDPVVRARLEDDLAEVGSGSLHARLAVVDPEAAQSILPSNGRRVVRALEVVQITGKPYAATLPEHEYALPAVTIGLRADRAVLDERIETRVQRMWDAGLVAEVRSLAEQGLREGRTASRALGYAQVLRQLDGEVTEREAQVETVRATRKFARRQESWFNRDPRIVWLDALVPDLVGRALEVVHRTSSAPGDGTT